MRTTNLTGYEALALICIQAQTYTLSLTSFLTCYLEDFNRRHGLHLLDDDEAEFDNKTMWKTIHLSLNYQLERPNITVNSQQQ